MVICCYGSMNSHLLFSLLFSANFIINEKLVDALPNLAKSLRCERVASSNHFCKSKAIITKAYMDNIIFFDREIYVNI